MHHGSVIQISDGRVIVKDVVYDCPTCRYFFRLPTELLVVVVDLDKRDLFFEFLPGGSIHPAISDFGKFGFWRRRRLRWVLLRFLGMQRYRILLGEVLAEWWKHVFFTGVHIFCYARIGIFIPPASMIYRNRRIPYLRLIFSKLVYAFYILEQLVRWVTNVEFFFQKWHSWVVFTLLPVQDLLLVSCQLMSRKFCFCFEFRWRHRTKWFFDFGKLLIFNAGILCFHMDEFIGDHSPILKASPDIFLTIRE